MTVDMVNHPPHYNQDNIECIDAIEAATGKYFRYYLQGNVMKYLWRFDYKGEPIKDLKNAQNIVKPGGLIIGDDYGWPDAKCKKKV